MDVVRGVLGESNRSTTRHLTAPLCPFCCLRTCGTGTLYVSGCRALDVWIFYALEKACRTGKVHAWSTTDHDQAEARVLDLGFLS